MKYFWNVGYCMEKCAVGKNVKPLHDYENEHYLTGDTSGIYAAKLKTVKRQSIKRIKPKVTNYF